MMERDEYIFIESLGAGRWNSRKVNTAEAQALREAGTAPWRWQFRQEMRLEWSGATCHDLVEVSPVGTSRGGMIENKVKLVIWDLDETFWRGTLSEEGITPIPQNASRVVELAKRGIISSICSKNDYDQTKAKLIELGIWDHFVFPTISFNPKGKAIAEMIEGAALRAENVLFIDDNPMNLEEAKFFNPGIMTAHPGEVLEDLLDHPHLRGKPDPELTRLNQYRFLQRKVEERGASALSNEEFLRASNIRISIDYDVSANFDRIVDLVNRANQLNYTKIRLETPGDFDLFRKRLEGFGFHAGCVRAVDDYGDYGVIGFFLLQRRALIKRLHHFVFSCRTMNMGIEQFVYEMLDRPDIEVVGPVSYGLASHDGIDWIRVVDPNEKTMTGTGGARLVLVGGCDLLQLASYCSTNRTEFVNTGMDDAMVRYDDPGFILGDRTAIRNCGPLRRIPCWTYEDALRFDEALASAQLILASFSVMMNGAYVKTRSGILMRMAMKRFRKTRAGKEKWFDRSFEQVSLDADARAGLVTSSLQALADRSTADCRIFVLGSLAMNTTKESRNRERKEAYDEACRNFCSGSPDRFHFVDIATVLAGQNLVDDKHFGREGYFVLARHILARAAAHTPADAGEAAIAAQ
jgi:FkbH-like protein